MFRYLAFLLIPFCSAAQSDYQQLHNRSVVIDTHNDVLTKSIEKGILFDGDMTGRSHSDLARMKKGGVDVQVFSVWCDGSYGPGKGFAMANREIDTLYQWVKRNPSQMMIVKTPKDLRQAVKSNKLGCMMGVEGGHMIEDSMSYIDKLYDRGVRYMTLTWNNSTSWATSAMEESKNSYKNKKKGLDEFGLAVVKHMNKLGMIIDISHVGEQTFWDVIGATTKPVIASHSCAYSLCPVFRNLKDDQIEAVGKNGGVIQLNFFSGFVDSNYDRHMAAFNARHKLEKDTILKINPEPAFADQYISEKYASELQELRPPLSMLLDHLDHIVKLAGIDHVGLGSDFDGIGSSPKELDDVTSYPNITKALLERGYSKKDIRKILGENFERVFAANTN